MALFRIMLVSKLSHSQPLKFVRIWYELLKGIQITCLGQVRLWLHQAISEPFILHHFWAKEKKFSVTPPHFMKFIPFKFLIHYLEDWILPTSCMKSKTSTEQTAFLRYSGCYCWVGTLLKISDPMTLGHKCYLATVDFFLWLPTLLKTALNF